MATETVQTEVAESKTLKFLEQLREKNPKQNYHAVATIAMSALDIDAEMRNPDSQIRKDLLAAIDILDFIAFFNNVLLPEMVRKDMEIREMLENWEIYPKSSPSQPLTVEELVKLPLPPQDLKRIEPLKQLLADVEKLEKLTLKLQQFEVDWRIEKINFVKEKLEGAVKKIEERISSMPDDHPEKPELIKAVSELNKDILDLDQLKKDLLSTTETNVSPENLQALYKKHDEKNYSVLEKTLKNTIPEITSLKDVLPEGLNSIDSKKVDECNQIIGEISVARTNLKNSVDKYEGAFGKDLGLGDMMKKFDTSPNQTITALKDTLNLDIPQKNAHDVNHFKK